MLFKIANSFDVVKEPNLSDKISKLFLKLFFSSFAITANSIFHLFGLGRIESFCSMICQEFGTQIVKSLFHVIVSHFELSTTHVSQPKQEDKDKVKITSINILFHIKFKY
jgi:hypothetical protein